MKTENTGFLKLRDNLLFTAQFISPSSSGFVLASKLERFASLLTTTASSAYIITSDSTPFGVSLMQIKKNEGPKTLPSGTPVSTASIDDAQPAFVEVHCFLLDTAVDKIQIIARIFYKFRNVPVY